MSRSPLSRHGPAPLGRRIDPEIARAARRADIPDPSAIPDLGRSASPDLWLSAIVILAVALAFIYLLATLM